MADPLQKLKTPEINYFHEIIDTARKGTTMVKVDKQKLIDLLDDHATLYGELAKMGIYFNQ